MVRLVTPWRKRTEAIDVDMPSVSRRSGELRSTPVSADSKMTQ